MSRKMMMTAADPSECDGLPATGTFVASHDFAPTFEDFTFDAVGNAWGVALYEGGLYRVPYGGPAELLRPAVSGYARGTRFVPDGDLVSVDYPNNALLRIDVETLAVTLLTGALTSPNGVAIGDDGFVYLSQVTGDVLRIDPATGAASLLATSPVSNDGISFSPDYRTLYLNSDSTGDFMSLGIDAVGAVSTPLQQIATLPGPADGMVVDACGNAYVTQFFPPSLARVRPDGTVEPFIALPPDQLIVAANFGTGVGGWEADHLYLSDWLGGMLEFDAGVRGKWEPHLPGAPP
jgi:streptogramin lyase